MGKANAEGGEVNLLRPSKMAAFPSEGVLVLGPGLSVSCFSLLPLDGVCALFSDTPFWPGESVGVARVERRITR